MFELAAERREHARIFRARDRPRVVAEDEKMLRDNAARISGRSSKPLP